MTAQRSQFPSPCWISVFASFGRVLFFFPSSALDTRLGLIRARILGGDASRGRFLAFIDGHVMVAPLWLEEPAALLSEDPRGLVNFINFALDAKTF